MKICKQKIRSYSISLLYLFLNAYFFITQAMAQGVGGGGLTVGHAKARALDHWVFGFVPPFAAIIFIILCICCAAGKIQWTTLSVWGLALLAIGCTKPIISFLIY